MRLRSGFKPLGHWPVMSADEARAEALSTLRERVMRGSRVVARTEPVIAVPTPAKSAPEAGPRTTLQEVFSDTARPAS